MSDDRTQQQTVVLAMLEEARAQAARAGRAYDGAALDEGDPATPLPLASSRDRRDSRPGDDRDDGGDGRDDSDHPGFDSDGEPGTAPKAGSSVDPEVLARCALLDHSDTDNGERLLAHFGSDLLVLSQAKARAPLFLAWTGTHWDIDTGGPRAFAIAQNVGGRIALEARFLKMTPHEQRDIDQAKAALDKEEGDLTALERKMIGRAEKATDTYRKRVQRRIAHAVTSKNKGKLDAMLACAAPHIMREPNAFNHDHYKVACRGHTLAFRTSTALQDNPDYFDPDIALEDVPRHIRRKTVELTAAAGHQRDDLITTLIPVDYDPDATCPKWLDFMGEFLPDDDVRRMVQVATGIGLLGITVQKLFFHYGSGANGKSVYMETICRLLGDVAVTLPAESFFGEAKGGGSANPDLVRLYGKRHLRVQELPEGEDLREDLVKKLTGGEDIPARDLFQGFFDFRPIFTGHMSGNGYPKISGTDNGIWRRMVVVHWPKTIPIERQRDFEEVVSDFAPEHGGILNWMIEGCLIFLREGLVIPESVRAKTQEYRDTMDPTSAFCAACIVPDAEGHVAAKALYDAYANWCIDAGKQPVTMTRFGRIMTSKYAKEEGRVNRYLGIRLVHVPAAPQSGHDDFEGHYR